MSVHITGRALSGETRMLMQAKGTLDNWRDGLVMRMETEIDDLNKAFEDGFHLVTSEVVETDQGKAFWLLLRKPDTGAPGLLDELMSAAILPGAPMEQVPAASSPSPAPKPLGRVETIDDVLMRGDYVILDTETTDKNGSEIIQIAIINSRGETLLNTLVNPHGGITQGAIGVHGITADMVKFQPTFPELLPQLKELLTGKDIIVYNAVFDRKAFHQSGEAWELPKIEWKEIATWHCAMERFAVIYGQWNDWRKSFTWKKLSEAAAFYGVAADGAHDALTDCRITLEVCRKMVETGFKKVKSA
jgi:DNA polymerase-3 subunit epsilon